MKKEYNIYEHPIKEFIGTIIATIVCIPIFILNRKGDKMKEPIQITFEVGVPENQFESAMNTLIIALRDYKSFMEEGRKFLDYEKYKVQNNFIIDRMINNIKNFYEER